MKVVVTGSNGQVGTEVVAVFGARGDDVHAAGSADVTSVDEMRAHVVSVAPDVVVHCAAFTDVDGCELDSTRAARVNGEAVRVVCDAADEVGAFVIALSTDYVFDGAKASPYVESDVPNPVNVYGSSKLAGECAVDVTRHAIVRTSWVSGTVGRNVVKTVLRLLRAGGPLRFVTDQRGCPTIAHDLANGLARIVDERRPGIWHVTNQGAVSWYEFVCAVVDAAGGDVSRVEPITTAELTPPRAARRPANSVLASERLHSDELLRDFRDALPDLVMRL